jgi:radical SAM superfamily enzyme YgiQ (UPF0313 family)
MDLILVNPASQRNGSLNEHLGIMSLSSFIRSRGFTVSVMDMAIEALKVSVAAKQICQKKPAVLGISMLDATKEKGFALIAEVRRSGYKGKIVLGGYFPTFSAADILHDFPQVDYIVRGEGELTLYDLLEKLLKKNDKKLSEIAGLSYRESGQVFENPPRPLIADLDILPPVDRTYVRALLREGRPLRVFATRGCWGGCTFCDIVALYGSSPGKQWRRRSVSALIDELMQLVETYDTREFIFNDDQFLVKGKKALEYVEDFAAELEERRLDIRFDLMCRADTVSVPVMQRLKSVGLRRVFLGLESFDQRQLLRYNKGISVRQNLRALRILQRLEIDVIASVILADAYTTLYDLLKQFAVLFRLTRRYFNSRRCQISINKKLEVYRGGAVYQIYKQAGLLTRDDYLKGYDFKLKPLTAFRLNLLKLEEKIGRFVLLLKEILFDSPRFTLQKNELIKPGM